MREYVRLLSHWIFRYTAAFNIVTKQHLRGEKELSELSRAERPLLTACQIEGLQSATHVPLRVLDELTAIISKATKAGRVDSFTAMEMDRNVTQFEDDLGGAERVLKTKMPFAYIVHLRSFLLTWFLAFPFAMVERLGWGTIPVSFVMFYLLLGIDCIGVEIENPFGHDYNDLPLDAFNQTVCDNLWQLLSSHIEKAAQPEHGECRIKVACGLGQSKPRARATAWQPLEVEDA